VVKKLWFSIFCFNVDFKWVICDLPWSPIAWLGWIRMQSCSSKWCPARQML
jgi:hypothetical protein